MDIRALIGQNLRELRQARSLSQEDLAFECGLHRTYISGIERGARNPTATVIEKIAIALRVRPAALFANWDGARDRE